MKTFLFAVAFWSAILISAYFIALAVLEVDTSVVVDVAICVLLTYISALINTNIIKKKNDL